MLFAFFADAATLIQRYAADTLCYADAAALPLPPERESDFTVRARAIAPERRAIYARAKIRASGYVQRRAVCAACCARDGAVACRLLMPMSHAHCYIAINR